MIYEKFRKLIIYSFIFKKKILNYNNKFKVIPKNISKQFNGEILKLNNLSIVDLNHNELEILHLQGLLNEYLIKPLYLS